MLRNIWPAALLAACACSIQAQAPAALPGAAPSLPPVMNVLTVIGQNALGVPCLDCLLGLPIPSLGLPAPVGAVYRGQTYQVDSFLIDNSYTGPCSFTFQLLDSHKNVIASTTQTLDEVAGSQILLTTPITIPPTSYLGLGSVSNTATCGSTTTKSSSPVAIACVNNPPYCVE